MSTQRPIRVAVVGSGPAGFYAAGHLLGQSEPRVEVDVYERLPTPWGLVRGGVAPDHPKIKSVSRVYEKTAALPGFRFFGNVEVGRDLTHEELAEWYDAVLYAVGTAVDRRSRIPGEDLPGSASATEFVGWYNGHPDFQHHQFDLSPERAVVIGNGNVALDVARMLALTYDELKVTDIADPALDALRDSRVREIVMLGRRGPEQAAFTNPELRELGDLVDADVVIDPADLELSEELRDPDIDPTGRRNVELLRDYSSRAPAGKSRRVVLRFLVSPAEIVGTDRVEAVRLVRNELVRDESGILRASPTGEEELLEAGLVFRAIGYTGVPVPGVPFDERRGVIANKGGRVIGGEGVMPGAYVAGWIKRGPSGVIGTNKKCAQETVDVLLEDARDGRLPETGTLSAEEVAEALHQRVARLVEYAGWEAIDSHERAQGESQGRPRVKLIDVEEMLDVAGAKAPAGSSSAA